MSSEDGKDKAERELLKFAIDHLTNVYESKRPVIVCGFNIRANGDIILNVEVVNQFLAKDLGVK